MIFKMISLQKMHFLSPARVYQNTGFPEDRLCRFTDCRPSENLKGKWSPLASLLKGQMGLLSPLV